MTLSPQTQQAAKETSSENSAKKVANIREILATAGASLLVVADTLDDIATRLALKHSTELDAERDTLEACIKSLHSDADTQTLRDVVKAGDIDATSLPAILAIIPSDDMLRPLSKITADRLDKVLQSIESVLRMRENDVETASAAIFEITAICMAPPEGLANIQDKVA